MNLSRSRALLGTMYAEAYLAEFAIMDGYLRSKNSINIRKITGSGSGHEEEKGWVIMPQNFESFNKLHMIPIFPEEQYGMFGK
jgi:hypothetical protein